MARYARSNAIVKNTNVLPKARPADIKGAKHIPKPGVTGAAGRAALGTAYPNGAGACVCTVGAGRAANCDGLLPLGLKAGARGSNDAGGGRTGIGRGPPVAIQHV